MLGKHGFMYCHVLIQELRNAVCFSGQSVAKTSLSWLMGSISVRCKQYRQAQRRKQVWLSRDNHG